MFASIGLRHPWRLSPVVVAVFAACIATGCGVDLASSTGTSGDSDGYMDDAVANDGVELTKVVVLDWTGGDADLSTDWLAATDFSSMHLASGASLEESIACFQESVRYRVEEILSALEPAGFRVVTGEGDEHSDETVVYFTSDAIAGGGLQVGQAKLDRCDLVPGASVIVWGGTLLSLGDEFEYEEWVNAFANIAAHEVGHTVGFFHPDAVLTDLTEYEKNTELMLAVHTLSALLSRQGFVIPQQTCPGAIEREHGGIAYEISAASAAKRPAVAYKPNHGPGVIICTCGHETP